MAGTQPLPGRGGEEEKVPLRPSRVSSRLEAAPTGQSRTRDRNPNLNFAQPLCPPPLAARFRVTESPPPPRRVTSAACAFEVGGRGGEEMASGV